MNTTSQLYLDDDKRSNAIRTLISLGVEMFQRAYVIENLDRLIDFLAHHKAKPQNQKKLIEFLEPFIWNRLIDDVRILICFENILKAELIHKGVLIHRLQNNRGRGQREKPIKFQTLTDAERSKIDEFTLPISTIVRNESYFKLLSISSSIRVELSQIIDDRNRLHYLDSLNHSYSQSKAFRLREMKEYTNRLIEKLK